MQRQVKTSPFRGPDEVQSAGKHRRDWIPSDWRIDQWMMMRGENSSNPALVVLHGGPGFPETNFFRHYNSALEKSFTVVHWEQRGAGKSFTRDTPGIQHDNRTLRAPSR